MRATETASLFDSDSVHIVWHRDLISKIHTFAVAPLLSFLPRDLQWWKK
jgi:hypothetical protein